MRIAVVSPFVDRRHGTERAVAELVERLARDHGCEIHLYAQRVEDLSLSSPQGATSSGAVIWHKVPSIAGPHLLQFLAWMFSNGFLRRWHRAFRGISFDVVLSPGINCLHPDVVIVHALFHRLHELAGEGTCQTETHARLLRRLHRRLYYRLLTALERWIYSDPEVSLVAVSRRTAGLLRQYFGRSDVRVIPNAVDTSQFSLAARQSKRADARRRRGFLEGEFVLLLIGNDWKTKGLPTLLQSLPFLSDLPVRLLVVGSEAPQPFQLLAAKLGVGHNCVWELPSPDVLDFYAAADLYASPSLEDSFGLPVAEAMACGIPVITSSLAGVSDFVREPADGFVMKDPQDAEALAVRVRDVYAGRNRQSAQSNEANALPLWRWEQTADAVFSLLQSKRSHSQRG